MSSVDHFRKVDQWIQNQDELAHKVSFCKIFDLRTAGRLGEFLAECGPAFQLLPALLFSTQLLYSRSQRCPRGQELESLGGFLLLHGESSFHSLLYWRADHTILTLRNLRNTWNLADQDLFRVFPDGLQLSAIALCFSHFFCDNIKPNFKTNNNKFNHTKVKVSNPTFLATVFFHNVGCCFAGIFLSCSVLWCFRQLRSRCVVSKLFAAEASQSCSVVPKVHEKPKNRLNMVELLRFGTYMNIQIRKD